MTERPVALPPYVSSEQLHGPCFVLCPKAWRRGERKVLRVILPKLPALKRLQPVLYQPSVSGRGGAEPLWHARARALRAAGMSIRRIMAQLGLVNQRALQRVLAEYGSGAVG